MPLPLYVNMRMTGMEHPVAKTTSQVMLGSIVCLEPEEAHSFDAFPFDVV